ncbi:hypothetical protein ACHAPU_010759 [Fusarium lateritium]
MDAPNSPIDSGYWTRSRREGDGSNESEALVPVSVGHYRVAYPTLRRRFRYTSSTQLPESLQRYKATIIDIVKKTLKGFELRPVDEEFGDLWMRKINDVDEDARPTLIVILPWRPDAPQIWRNAIETIVNTIKPLLQIVDLGDLTPDIEFAAPELGESINISPVEDRPDLLPIWDDMRATVIQQLALHDATRDKLTTLTLLRRGPSYSQNPVTVYIAVDETSDERRWRQIITSIKEIFTSKGWTGIEVHIEENMPSNQAFPLLPPHGTSADIEKLAYKNNFLIKEPYQETICLGDDIGSAHYLTRDDNVPKCSSYGTIGCFLEIQTRSSPGRWVTYGLTNHHVIRTAFQGFVLEKKGEGSVAGHPVKGSPLWNIDEQGLIAQRATNVPSYEHPSRIKHNYTVYIQQREIQEMEAEVHKSNDESSKQELTEMKQDLANKVAFFDQGKQIMGNLFATSGFTRRSTGNQRLDWALISITKPRDLSNRLPRRDAYRDFGFSYTPKPHAMGVCLRDQRSSILPLDGKSQSHLPTTSKIWKVGARTGLTMGKFSEFKSMVRIIDDKHLAAPVSDEYTFFHERPFTQTMFSSNGDSGAIIYDENGCIVGLAFTGCNPSQANSFIGFSYVTPIEYVFSDIKAQSNGEIVAIRIAQV